MAHIANQKGVIVRSTRGNLVRSEMMWCWGAEGEKARLLRFTLRWIVVEESFPYIVKHLSNAPGLGIFLRIE